MQAKLALVALSEKIFRCWLLKVKLRECTKWYKGTQGNLGKALTLSTTGREEKVLRLLCCLPAPPLPEPIFHGWVGTGSWALVTSRYEENMQGGVYIANLGESGTVRNGDRDICSWRDRSCGQPLPFHRAGKMSVHSHM